MTKHTLKILRCSHWGLDKFTSTPPIFWTRNFICASDQAPLKIGRARSKSVYMSDREKTRNIHFLSVCSYHVTYTFQRESTLYSCLNVKELLARSRREIWSWSDCNVTRTHNHLVRKRTLNHSWVRVPIGLCLLKYLNFEPSFKLWWCRSQDLFGSQIPVTIEAKVYWVG